MRCSLAIASLLILVSSLFTCISAESKNESIIIDPLNYWKRCSLEGGEWSICLQPTGYGLSWYCPLDESEHALEKLGNISWYGIQTDFHPCFKCPTEDSPLGSDCLSTMTTLVEQYNITPTTNEYEDIFEVGIEYCAEMCEAGLSGDGCSDENKCTGGSHFCDYSGDDELTGVCKMCPADVGECFNGGFSSSDRSLKECYKCRLACYDVAVSSLSVDGEELTSEPIYSATQESTLSASGPLVDCSDIILADVDICPDAEGSVCLVGYYTLGVRIFGDLFYEISDKAEKSGCVAMIKFDLSSFIGGSHHSYDHLTIPFVSVGTNDGNHLKNNKIGSTAHVGSEIWGSACYPSFDTIACNDKIPCQDADTYCDYSSVVQNGVYVEGECVECPKGEGGEPDPLGCYFERREASFIKTQEEVESCAKSCGAYLTYDECKFCPNDISAFEFGVENKADQCHFCPQNDNLHPDRFVPLFGKNITCRSMQAFFERLEVPKDSENCQLAQSFNYICGCQGPGYAGASTQAKKNALVWVPRVTAMLSVMGSLFVLIDVLRERSRRSKPFFQLMAQMSFFDIIGSVAYAFTSLPIPSNFYFPGAHGNKASCTSQGFFIQVGTVACFTNVSLAVYYFLMIKKGWSQTRLKKVILWLLICPVIVGMTFAFAGIPFMGNLVLWCNNSAPWWPDIPVAIAIFVATFIMGSVFWDVYKKDQASKRWRQRGDSGSGNSISTKVFWQSVWYLMSFYATWPPYLALQYFWASGKAYDTYYFILFAGALVPLQGVWNWFVYARNRQLQGLRTAMSSYISSRLLTGTSFRSANRSSTNRSSNNQSDQP
mmetsp:Transcript_25638/g.33976  ORF Transcript_25638/g.33976 Transcript_25638/m.33976 type:complete len:828 (+) Transcript_25638:53-2536(+)